ncbi:MAG TPA: glycogen debranching enzyme N-terminal domain-containing protein, partial [Candidatus Limnocylindrales bacterium]|nr:glycogen debranching enzyme N-terminal domain-containing protein [Candidatus Limnocylindrales bacterium]
MTIRFDAAECRDLARALEREWLVVNGLGGYASGTLAGVNTRRYHGLLMAALRPPMQRVLCLAVVETWWVPADGSVRALVGHEHPDGTVSPVAAPDEVVLDGRLPRWRWRFGNDVVERRLWMDPDQNRTVMTFRLLQGAAGRLRLRPLFALRPAD